MSPVRVVLSGLGAIANILQTFGRVPSSVGKCCAFHVRRAVIELSGVAAVARFVKQHDRACFAWETMGRYGSDPAARAGAADAHSAHTALCLQTRDDRTCPITEGAMA